MLNEFDSLFHTIPMILQHMENTQVKHMNIAERAFDKYTGYRNGNVTAMNLKCNG